MSDCPIDRVTLAMVSLAANIAANHPKKGLCQMGRLQSYGVPQEQIDIVVDIARHLRNEAGQMLDHEFDTAASGDAVSVSPPASLDTVAAGACCSPTAKGNACC